MSEFDKIREKLYDVQMPVGADVWGDIQATLRRRRIRKVLYYVSSSAAIILLALLLLLPSQQEHKGIQVQTVQTVEQGYGDIQAQPEPEMQLAVQEIRQEDGAGQKSRPSSRLLAQEVGGQNNTAVSGKEETDDKAVLKEEVSQTVQVAQKREDNAGEKGETVTAAKQENILLDDQAWIQEGNEAFSKRQGFTLAYTQGVMPGSTASVAGSWVRASSAFGGAVGHNHIVEQISDIKYSLPVNMGVQAQFPLGENMAIGVGVTYSLLKSKYDCLIDKVKYNVKQKLHYVGIPVSVYGLVADRNNFSFYINGGVTFEKGVRAVYNMTSYKDSQSHSSDIDGLQFSINAGFGVEYKFGNVVGVYFEPNLVYCTNSDVMYSIRTDQPFQIKADVGFRFHF